MTKSKASAGASDAGASQLFISEIQHDSVELFLVGTSSLFLNRMAEKAQHELLFPKRKTMADRAGSLKHDPLAEFRSSAHTIKSHDSATLLGIPATAPKRAMATAALDTPGAKKTQIGRLTWIDGELLGVYGIPSLSMSMVRSSGMDHTPDVRTRCAVKEWAIRIRVHYCTPILTMTSIWTLLANAGIAVGIGDWRQEKGGGSHGQFRPLALAKESEIAHILSADRVVQQLAMDTPDFYDDESEELYGWFQSELEVRGRKAASQDVAPVAAPAARTGYTPPNSRKPSNGVALR